MSYTALARTWRPKSFSELLGQSHLTNVLMNSLDKNRIHHAYLFTGTRGVGKTSVARLFAKSLNCEKGISSNPCLKCDACLAIEHGRFIDLIEIDGASRTRVEDTRDLLDNVQYSPTNARFKIYLIDEVHMLSQHSFNALLKTLEEPPAHVKFLLATTDPQKLPVTVLSRCLQFNLKHISEDIIYNHLQHILEQENLNYDAEGILLLAKSARGSMRDALSLLDQAIAGCQDSLNTLYIKDMLGFTQQDYAIPILKALLIRDTQQFLTLSHDISMGGGQFSYVLNELISSLHQMALCQTLPDASSLISVNDEIKLLSQQFTPEDIQLMYQIAIKGLDEILLSPSISIGFEMTLLRMYSFRMAPLQKKPMLSNCSKFFEPSKSPDEGLAQDSIDHKKSVSHEDESKLLLHKDSSSRDLSKSPITLDADKNDIENIATADNSSIDDEYQNLNSQHPLINTQSNISNDKTSIDANKYTVSDESNPIEISKTQNFSLSWVELLPKLKLRGLALSAAENAQISSQLSGRIVLQIEKGHQSLFTPQVQKQVEKALSEFYNEKTLVSLEYTEQISSSPAVQKKNNQEKMISDATSALHNDPFFQQLQDEFSAELQENSITSLKDRE